VRHKLLSKTAKRLETLLKSLHSTISTVTKHQEIMSKKQAELQKSKSFENLKTFQSYHEMNKKTNEIHSQLSKLLKSSSIKYFS
jgi:hypothetical protein